MICDALLKNLDILIQGRRQDFQKGGSALSIESPQRGGHKILAKKYAYVLQLTRIWPSRFCMDSFRKKL